MDPIAANRPQVGMDQILKALSEYMTLKVESYTALPSDRDQNVLIETEEGTFVLKVANPFEPKEALDLQNATMLHLANKPIGITTPVPVAAKDGHTLCDVEFNGTKLHIRLSPYVAGTPLAQARPHNRELMGHLGSVLGRLTNALKDFSHPAQDRDLHWDLRQAEKTIEDHRQTINDSDKNSTLDWALQYWNQVQRLAPELPQSVIHGDANDHNILVNKIHPRDTGFEPRKVVGLIDFGDMTQSWTVAELAIACAYIMLEKKSPLTMAREVVRRFHEERPLSDQELEALFPLVVLRLATSVSVSAFQQAQEPANKYLSVTSEPAWNLLQKFAAMPEGLAHLAFRQACGLEPIPHSKKLLNALSKTKVKPVVAGDPSKAHVFDLSVGNLLSGEIGNPEDMAEWTEKMFAIQKAAAAPYGVGRYGEARLLYATEAFNDPVYGEPRTVHLGMDLFAPVDTPVMTPLDGIVRSLQNNNFPRDYGPTVILEHELDGVTFYTLYGHLTLNSLDNLTVGQSLKAGDEVGTMGDLKVNGDWPPHTHFQIILDRLGIEGDFPGVCTPAGKDLWQAICPDPNLLLRIPEARFPKPELDAETLMHEREQILGRNLSVSYRKPLKIVRGKGQYLYDHLGRSYLDGVNNVCHVGHAHPKVVDALKRQASVLNTNTRYLHETILEYARELTATFPEPLSVCFLVCTGSEANELALRLARAHTHRRDVLVIDAAYHGHTSTLIDMSPYKHKAKGGQGPPDYVHTLDLPDPYRGKYQTGNLGQQYAQDAEHMLTRLRREGSEVAAFFHESLLGCGGQIVLPDGYLREMYGRVRSFGGLCVADEVQVGFGRVGSHMWAFETQSVVPDIVTMGKPIGNGHPLAAVVTTPDIAASFDNGMEYFNTFGGNPVSCAVGREVLRVIQEENLQAHALEVGTLLISELKKLKSHAVVGDVRGLGLFAGVELVLDRETKTPAPKVASYVAERMRDHGILISTDGPDHNVLKLKPPLVFSREDAFRLGVILDKVLGEDFVVAATG
ncbi:MAG: aminotransferase class III-fold pyridoxal phosphate-dependent enzyme [Candidatus Eisenbacteria bacterium]|uniref:Aminotransferase class III-fold pyridoxal phosphate-dependent enzyme n=1 Tax=Eiseniibacteriota bacterium TaxID=2212470 RepID=A0A7Y2E4U8_UNCEI|nr:aminotransferase class III-fold pyridoxal phosphate-dependent enzyme [Candidatus Eisenbacteria bacterium]